MGNAGNRTVERDAFESACRRRDYRGILRWLGILIRVGQGGLMEVAEALVILSEIAAEDPTTSRYSARLLARIVAGTPSMDLDEARDLLDILEELPDVEAIRRLGVYVRRANYPKRPMAPLRHTHEWDEIHRRQGRTA